MPILTLLIFSKIFIHSPVFDDLLEAMDQPVLEKEGLGRCIVDHVSCCNIVKVERARVISLMQ